MMNSIVLFSIIGAILILLPISFSIFAKNRQRRILKEKNYSVIKERFSQSNRSSKGSPY